MDLCSDVRRIFYFDYPASEHHKARGGQCLDILTRIVVYGDNIGLFADGDRSDLGARLRGDLQVAGRGLNARIVHLRDDVVRDLVVGHSRPDAGFLRHRYRSCQRLDIAAVAVRGVIGREGDQDAAVGQLRHLRLELTKGYMLVDAELVAEIERARTVERADPRRNPGAVDGSD